MSKSFKILSLVISFISLFSLALAQTTDSIRIVTYYPSPYGSYAELRTKKLAVGAGYINAGTLAWNTGGPCMPNEICNADLIVEGNVGIGTTQPWTTLDISNAGYSIANRVSAANSTFDITWSDFGDLAPDTSPLFNNYRWDLTYRGTHAGGNHELILAKGTAGGQAAIGSVMTWLPNGNVGIGTTEPGTYGIAPNQHEAKLDVNGYVATNDVWLKDVNKWASEGGGSVVQVAYFQTGQSGSGNTAIPFDDTVPQSNEGTQFMSATIIPKSATNLLKIDVVCHVWNTGSAASYLNVALFKNNDPDAIASTFQIGRAEIAAPVNFTHYMVAGTTDSITFKVKAGGIAGTTTYFNRYDALKFGGTMASSITITELKP